MPINRSSRGFTLIELLLGLTLFSIIAYTVYATFASGMNLNKRAEAVSKIHRQSFWTLEVLTQELENMVPYDFSQSYENLTAFEGQDDELRFMLPTEEGLKVVKYYLGTPDRSQTHKVLIGHRTKRNVRIVQGKVVEDPVFQLVREEIPLVDFLNDVEGEAEIISDIIAKDGLAFSYAKRNKENEISWEESWDEDKVPSGVKIKLTMLNEDDPEKPVQFERNVYIPIGSISAEE